MVEGNSGEWTAHVRSTALLLGLILSCAACSSSDDGDGSSQVEESASGEDASTPDETEDEDASGPSPRVDGGKPTTADAAKPQNRNDAGSPRDSGKSPGGDSGATSEPDASNTRDGDASVSQADGGQGTSDAGQVGDSGAPVAPGPSDYSQRGPHKVLIEKNVGKDFRNTNVTDQTAFCRAFVGGVMLPGEMGVDEELTNYPADMDRQLYTMFRPDPLEEGVKYPVITWGNGTCAQPLLYNEILEHLASWGYIIIATNATSVGSAVEMLRGVDFVLKENTTQGSALFGHVDPMMIGATGHSQGSSGSVAAGADARIKATVPIEGASAAGVRALKGPTFLISGEKDTLVTPASIMSAYSAATVPAVYGMSIGLDHLMPGRMPMQILKGITGWFRIHLSKDDAARPLFYGATCELCSDKTWTIMRKNL